MADRIVRNEARLRATYTGAADTPRFLCQPAQLSFEDFGLPPHDFTFGDPPIQEYVAPYVANYQRQVEFLDEVDDDSVPVAKLTTATHIYAAAFGCPVHTYEEATNPCAVPLVYTAAEADALPEPEVHASPMLERVYEMAGALRRELGPDVYFGPSDIQSGFDIAAQVWNKEDFFIAIMDPDQQPAVERLVGKCARLLKTHLAEMRRLLAPMSPCHCPGAWVPPELGPWLSNDECGAFNTKVFERFCLPELIDLAETFGGLGMHCCADAEHQFEAFKRIPDFYAFNRVGGKAGWAPLLEHFSGSDAPVHVLAWLEDEVIEWLLREAAPGTRFVFQRPFDTADEANEWLDCMRSLAT